MINKIVARSVVDLCSEYFRFVAYDVQRAYVSICCWGSTPSDAFLKRTKEYVRANSVKSTFRFDKEHNLLNIKMRF